MPHQSIKVYCTATKLNINFKQSTKQFSKKNIKVNEVYV